jgi:hypothetical protein
VRRAFLITVAVVAFLTGCGGGGDESTASGEWTRHAVRDTTASLALPEEWKVLREFDAETIADFTKENEDFAPYVDPLVRNDVFKLFALDPDIQDDFATNLNVVVTPVDQPLIEWVESETVNARRIAVPGSLKSRYIQTPAGEAAKLDWLVDLKTGGESRQMHATQYLFQKDGAGYVLSFSTLPSLAAKYEPTFTKSARSFQFG